MVRIEASSTFSVEREAGFDYITEPTNWPQFWPDLVDIPDLGGARWKEPGDTMRLRMRLAGRLTDVHMTLDHLERPELVRYHSAQKGLFRYAATRALRQTIDNLAQELPARGAA